MFLDDTIYQAYLEEMRSLESFRASHTALYKDTPIELIEDPDTTRLVEALAFFSARTRLQGLNRIAQLHQVLFRQYFSFLINPLPSMGLVQIQPSLRIPEVISIPEGSELMFHTYDERKATFQTLGNVDVSPLFFSKFQFQHKIQGGWRLEITYQSPHVRSDELGQISLYINHLNHFSSSLRVYFALSRSLETVKVYYDETNIKNKEGTLCNAQFGFSCQPNVFNHPLERIRAQLHYPEQETFLTISIPPHQRKWESITLCFDLNDKWPAHLALTKESLLPFIVPIANLKKERADPIECDGTKDSYPILYPNPIHHFSLHTILNVCEVVPEGMKPLKPGILDKQGSTYEIDYFKQHIILDLPKAFQNPRHVSVEALWTQLWFSDYIDQEFKVRLAEDQFADLQPNLLQEMRGHESTVAARDPKFLLRLLALKNQNKLDLSEILFLMNSLKNLDHSHFKAVPALIKELKVEQQIDRKGRGLIMCYQFQLKEWDGKNWEMIVLFFHHLNSFLNCWLSNFHVETKVFFPHVKTPLTFKGGIDNELSILARDFFLS